MYNRAREGMGWLWGGDYKIIPALYLSGFSSYLTIPTTTGEKFWVIPTSI